MSLRGFFVSYRVAIKVSNMTYMDVRGLQNKVSPYFKVPLLTLSITHKSITLRIPSYYPLSPLGAKPYPQVGKVAKQELRNESKVPKQELGNQVMQLVPKLLLGNDSSRPENSPGSVGIMRPMRTRPT
jgi:hypothetical protein